MLAWSGIEVVITSTTGNRVAVMSGTRVQIPPTPPYCDIFSKKLRMERSFFILSKVSILLIFNLKNKHSCLQNTLKNSM